MPCVSVCHQACNNPFDVFCFVTRRCWSKLGRVLGVFGGVVAGIGLLAVAIKFGWLASLLSSCCGGSGGANAGGVTGGGGGGCMPSCGGGGTAVAGGAAAGGTAAVGAAAAAGGSTDKRAREVKDSGQGRAGGYDELPARGSSGSSGSSMSRGYGRGRRVEGRLLVPAHHHHHLMHNGGLAAPPQGYMPYGVPPYGGGPWSPDVGADGNLAAVLHGSRRAGDGYGSPYGSQRQLLPHGGLYENQPPQQPYQGSGRGARGSLMGVLGFLGRGGRGGGGARDSAGSAGGGRGMYGRDQRPRGSAGGGRTWEVPPGVDGVAMVGARGRAGSPSVRGEPFVKGERGESGAHGGVPYGGRRGTGYGDGASPRGRGGEGGGGRLGSRTEAMSWNPVYGYDMGRP